VIDKSWGGPTVTKDGVTVADEIDLTDRAENLGAKLVKQAASKISKIAGDGTTTATVLTEALFKEAYKNLTAGADGMALKRGMEAAAKAVVEKLASLAKPVDITKANEIINVASVSANNDREIGKIMAEAFQRVGKTASSGRGSKSFETTIEFVEACSLTAVPVAALRDRSDKMVCELEKPYILVTKRRSATWPS
jgi:chaperonin GroEL